MDNVKTMQEILSGLQECNNDVNYQYIQISTKYPDLPEEVKGFIAVRMLDREINASVIKELGKGIVERDKYIDLILREIEDIKRGY